MNNNNNILLRIALVLVAYLGIKYLIPNGNTILYPINLFVTFLHEFGHAAGALITGGKVASIQVNHDGSGLCYTAGGNRAIILMGGYIGSAIFGNMLLFIGTKYPKMAKFTLVLLAIAMIFTSIFWYDQMFTTGLLLAFSIIFIALAWLTDFSGDILMFLGLASIIHIIEDFNVGPTSDLQKYAEIFVVIPMNVWMYIWLIIVIILFLINIRWILKGAFNEKKYIP